VPQRQIHFLAAVILSEAVLGAPRKPMRTVILSEVREANAVEGPAVALVRFQVETDVNPHLRGNPRKSLKQ
jgi:hypothetical protein